MNANERHVAFEPKFNFQEHGWNAQTLHLDSHCGTHMDASKRMKLLGVEPPSVADVHNLPEVIQIHQTLLGGGVLIVDGLTNLEAITQEKVLFAALPLKPLRGDGSPVRAFAMQGEAIADC